MKKKYYSLFITLSLTVLLIVFQYFLSIQWWWFVFPTFIAGVLLPPKRLKTRVFIVGFVAGSLSWMLPHLYFQMTYSGNLFPQIAVLIGVPSWVLLIGLGVIAGTLSGLALVSGKQLRTGREPLKLDLED